MITVIRGLSTPFSLFFIISAQTLIAAKPWYPTITKKETSWVVGGAAVACIAIPLLYYLYHRHTSSHEQFITKCRKIYRLVHAEVQHHYTFYYYDAQASDLQLKDIITQTVHDPYPFIAYYTLLTKKYWTLKQYLATLERQLMHIKHHTQQLNKQRTENNAQLEEKFLQLTIKGKQLQDYVIKTMTLISILKKRIKLFREYGDDCHNWTQGERNKPTTPFYDALRDQEHVALQ